VARSSMVEVEVPFPVQGVDRQFSFANQPFLTTPKMLNCAPFDPPTGRHRGGVRPVLVQLVSLGNAPYHWCKASYLDANGVSRDGIAVAHAGGVNTTITGSDFTAATATPEIATNPGTDFTTCAVFRNYLYMARNGGTCREKALNAATAEEALRNAGGGTAPTGCGLVWVHQGRLALAKDHQVFMSATGDATNWDYTVQTVGGAWANSGTYAGQVGDIVVAAIAYDRNISYVGSPRSIYGINGNPRVGGTAPVSDTIGPLMNNAWCKGRDANGSPCLWMMTYDGLYLQQGGFGEPIAISRKKIPNELIGVDPGAGDKCCIGYDPRWPAVHISIDPNTGSDSHWIYYLPTDAWLEWSLPVTPHVYATFPKVQTDDRSAILPIGSDGSVRQYDNAEDEGGSNESFDSYVFLVIDVSQGAAEGMLHAISASLANGSDNLTGEIYVGQSYEEAYDKALAGSSPDFTLAQLTQASGQYWNYWQHVMLRGVCAILKIKDTNDTRWLVEQIVVRLKPRTALRRVHG
jgi:hypothetical protein